jgi:hypothetical protein
VMLRRLYNIHQTYKLRWIVEALPVCESASASMLLLSGTPLTVAFARCQGNSPTRKAVLNLQSQFEHFLNTLIAFAKWLCS